MNYENLNQKLNNIKFQKNDNRYKLSGREFDAQLLISNYLKGENTNNIFERFENINANISVQLNNIFIDKNSKMTNLVGEISLKKMRLFLQKLALKLTTKMIFHYL